MSRRPHLSWSLAGTAALVGLAALALWERVPELPSTQEVEKPMPEEIVGDRPTAREMAGGEVHSYRMRIAAGEYVRLAAEQRRIDVVLDLFGPGGAKLTTVDSPLGMKGVERVSEVAATAGEYRLDVRAAKGATPGRYELRLEERRPAGEEDRRRVAAERAFHQGEELRREERARAAIPSYRRALELWRGLEDRRSEAEALNALGRMHFSLGELDDALASCRQALALFESLGEVDKQIALHNRLGSIHLWRGEVEAALAEHRAALEQFQERGDLEGQATSLNLLGSDYLASGERWRAREHYLEALALWRTLGDGLGQARTLKSLGDLAVFLGRLPEALDRYREAMDLFAGDGGRRRRANLLNSLGWVHNQLGQPEKAREYLEQALPLWRDLEDPSGTGICLQLLGLSRAKQGEPAQAFELYRQSLGLFRQAGDRQGGAAVLAETGWLHHRTGDPEEALRLYDQALPLAEAVGDRSLRASVLYAGARALRDLGRLEAARERAEAAIAQVESLRRAAASKALRASYFATRQDYYDLAIDVLLRLAERHPRKGHAAAALRWSEQRRARGLLDALTQGRTDVRGSAAPALFAQDRALAQRLEALEQRRLDLFDAGAPEAEVAGVEAEARRLLEEQDRLRTRVAAADPGYADLVAPRILSVAEIEREVLDEETVLLAYSLGEERSFLWLVEPGTVSSFVLPPRERLEELVRGAHSSWGRSDQRAARSAERHARALSEALLGPVAGRLGERRLLIVGDGALQYLPFAALPEPGGNGEPLVVRHEIVHLPSASVLAALRRQQRGHEEPAGVVAVMADPVFDAGDPRVRGKAEAIAERRREPDSDLARSARDLGLHGFDRLPDTRREAGEILALAPEGRKLEALDFAASRETVVSGRLKGYRILHFATHGLLHGQPDLSGLVLSQVDAAGRPVEGFLRVHEVYGLELPSDLVVLSACRTGLGREIRGEGLVGLTQAFFHAGAARVVVSLWNVGDRSTAELMSRFYRGMFREGLPPAAALRSAQVSMLREERWASPHRWAGFVFQGEWAEF